MNKREQNKELRRRLIIDAGLDVFSTNGFTAAKLEDVAKEAGVAKGTIYLYFENKEALFEEVVRECLLPSINEAEALLAEFEGPASELLTLHFTQFYTTMAKNKVPQIISLLIGEVARFPTLSEFFYRELISRKQESMRQVIQRGVDSGEFRQTNVEEFTQILVAPAIIGSIWTVQFNSFSPLNIEAFAKTHIDLLLRGLLA